MCLQQERISGIESFTTSPRCGPTQLCLFFKVNTIDFKNKKEHFYNCEERKLDMIASSSPWVIIKLTGIFKFRFYKAKLAFWLKKGLIESYTGVVDQNYKEMFRETFI